MCQLIMCQLDNVPICQLKNVLIEKRCNVPIKGENIAIGLQHIPYPTAQPIGTLAYWHIDKLLSSS